MAIHGRTGLSREVDQRHSILCSASWTVGTRDEPVTSWGLEEEWSVCYEKTSEDWEAVCSHCVRFYTRRSDDGGMCVEAWRSRNGVQVIDCRQWSTARSRPGLHSSDG
jgi:hypothetical protein